MKRNSCSVWKKTYCQLLARGSPCPRARGSLRQTGLFSFWATFYCQLFAHAWHCSRGSAISNGIRIHFGRHVIINSTLRLALFVKEAVHQRELYLDAEQI
jgi:hypothetical protein